MMMMVVVMIMMTMMMLACVVLWPVRSMQCCLMSRYCCKQTSGTWRGQGSQDRAVTVALMDRR